MRSGPTGVVGTTTRTPLTDPVGRSEWRSTGLGSPGVSLVAGRRPWEGRGTSQTLGSPWSPSVPTTRLKLPCPTLSVGLPLGSTGHPYMTRPNRNPVLGLWWGRMGSHKSLRPTPLQPTEFLVPRRVGTHPRPVPSLLSKGKGGPLPFSPVKLGPLHVRPGQG